jgi:hypothetical protein
MENAKGVTDHGCLLRYRLGRRPPRLARAQQDTVWARTTAHNKLRSHLREYYPGFLAAFAGKADGILRPEARVILAAAPAPADAARLREAFRASQMRQLPLVEHAMVRQAMALLRQLDAACASADELEAAAIESF